MALVAVADAHLLAARRVQQEVEVLRRELADRHVRPEAAPLRHGLHDLAVPGVRHGHARPRQQRALRDRQRLRLIIRSGSNSMRTPRPGARRARAVRRVERERARLELVDRVAVERAAVFLAVALLLERARRPPARRPSRLRPGAARSRPSRRTGPDPGWGGPRPNGLPSSSAWRTTRRSTTTSIVWRLYLSSDCDLVQVEHARRRRGCGRSPACARHRRRGRPPSCGRGSSGPRIRMREPSGSARIRSTICGTLWRWISWPSRAMRVADTGEQQAQVVVDLRDRADRRTRVARRALLVDRDRRRQAVDLVDVRLLHLAQELARVALTGSRRSAAGPRRRSCRTPGWTCRCPRAR